MPSPAPNNLRDLVFRLLTAAHGCLSRPQVMEVCGPGAVGMQLPSTTRLLAINSMHL